MRWHCSRPGRRTLRIRTHYLVGATAGLTVVVVAALAVGVALNPQYFLDYRRWATLAVTLLMAALIALGFRLMRVGSESAGRPSAMTWLGTAIVWGTVLTPVVIGIVWWAFFSEGDV